MTSTQISTQTKLAIVALASIINVQAFAAPPTPLAPTSPTTSTTATTSKINSTPLVWVDATGKIVGRAFGLNVLVYTYNGKLTMFNLESTSGYSSSSDYDSRYGVPSNYYDVFFQDSNCTGTPFIPIIATSDASHNAFGARLSAVVNDTVYISTSDTPSSITSFNSFLEAGGCIVYSSEHFSYPTTPVPLSTLMTLPLHLQ